MSKIYVKTDYVPDDVDYLTPNKVYTAKLLENRFACIINDAGGEQIIRLCSCSFLGDNPWVITTKKEYESQRYNPDSISLEECSYSDFRVGNQLKPIGKFTTGYAQIIAIEDDVYTLLTDFGNIFDLSFIEIKSRYEHIGLIDFDGNIIDGPHMSVEERWNKQQELLAEAKSRLINMGYFKEGNV